MKKEKFHIICTQNNTTSEWNCLGEYDRKKKLVTHKETNKHINTVTIDLNKKILIEDNIEYRIIFNFEKEEYEILLKEDNSIGNMKIELKRFEYGDSSIDIEYNMIETKDKFRYRIEIGD